MNEPIPTKREQRTFFSSWPAQKPTRKGRNTSRDSRLSPTRSDGLLSLKTRNNDASPARRSVPQRIERAGPRGCLRAGVTENDPPGRKLETSGASVGPVRPEFTPGVSRRPAPLRPELLARSHSVRSHRTSPRRSKKPKQKTSFA